jgi:hypothetical protein
VSCRSSAAGRRLCRAHNSWITGRPRPHGRRGFCNRGEPVVRCPTESNSAASNIALARFDFRIIRAMPSSGRPCQDGRVRGEALVRCLAGGPPLSRLRQRDAADSDCCSGLSPAGHAPGRSLARSGRLRARKAPRRSRVAHTPPREALCRPQRQLRVVPTPAPSRGCRSRRVTRRVVLVVRGRTSAAPARRAARCGAKPSCTSERNQPTRRHGKRA